MAFDDILKMSPDEMFAWAMKEFPLQPISKIETKEDMEIASQMIAEAVANYVYLTSLLSFMKIKIRQQKRSGDKTETEDLIDKREVIQQLVDATKMQYSGISRMVTIKMDIDKELNMNTIR